MNLGFVFLMAIGLAMDACAISLTAGFVLKKVQWGHTFRMAGAFGFSQFAMPILGWWAGRVAASAIQMLDHWAAFFLLLGIGTKMILEAFWEKEEKEKNDPTRGWRLLALSLASSIDAMAAGIGLAFLDMAVLWPCAIIGLVTFVLCGAGIRGGAYLGLGWGRRVEITGGLILIGLGIKILIDHTCNG